MSKIDEDDGLKQFFSKGANRYDIKYDEGDWKKMEKMLDAEDGRFASGRSKQWKIVGVVTIGLLLLLAPLYFVVKPMLLSDGTSSIKSGERETTSNPDDLTGIIKTNDKKNVSAMPNTEPDFKANTLIKESQSKKYNKLKTEDGVLAAVLDNGESTLNNSTLVDQSLLLSEKKLTHKSKETSFVKGENIKLDDAQLSPLMKKEMPEKQLSIPSEPDGGIKESIPSSFVSPNNIKQEAALASDNNENRNAENSLLLSEERRKNALEETLPNTSESSPLKNESKANSHGAITKSGSNEDAPETYSDDHNSVPGNDASDVVINNALQTTTSSLPMKKQMKFAEIPDTVKRDENFNSLETAKNRHTNSSTKDADATQALTTRSLNDSVKNIIDTAVSISRSKVKTEPERSSEQKLLHSYSRWSITFAIAPDFSTSKGIKNTGTGSALGLTLQYDLSKRLALQTGALLSRKKYWNAGSDYEGLQGYWNYKTSGVLPDRIDGKCSIIEIPIAARYTILNVKKNRVQASAGVSSYVMLSEAYSYNYGDPYPVEQHWESSQTKYYMLGIGSVSVAFERLIHPKLAIGIEPYAKIPFTKIGWGNLPLYSLGAYVTMRYRL